LASLFLTPHILVTIPASHWSGLFSTVVFLAEPSEETAPYIHFPETQSEFLSYHFRWFLNTRG
jgi:hypothetical protein